MRATTLEGIANLANLEKCLSLVKKCFGVTDCPEDRKVRLTTFLLQGNIGDWFAMVFVMDEEDKFKHFEKGIKDNNFDFGDNNY
ncbi:uncharacterized protein E5676_scaffold142G001420 [Cucumis melo var. makuwa]|uniref:Uncharacterized protein n=1 Tax=Cucumis melo var. makuwa TaxID=1194695 RepID=A0A5D3DI51_CUCMM|nr:uncharacterized protein E5676_scaffold142G001420 [Cucumis melo var. makuwa]